MSQRGIGWTSCRRQLVAHALGLAFDQTTIDAALHAQQACMVAVLDMRPWSNTMIVTRDGQAEKP